MLTRGQRVGSVNSKKKETANASIELVLCSVYWNVNDGDIFYDAMSLEQWMVFEEKQFNQLWDIVGDLISHVTPPVP